MPVRGVTSSNQSVGWSVRSAAVACPTPVSPSLRRRGRRPADPSEVSDPGSAAVGVPGAVEAGVAVEVAGFGGGGEGVAGFSVHPTSHSRIGSAPDPRRRRGDVTVSIPAVVKQGSGGRLSPGRGADRPQFLPSFREYPCRERDANPGRGLPPAVGPALAPDSLRGAQPRDEDGDGRRGRKTGTGRRTPATTTSASRGRVGPGRRHWRGGERAWSPGAVAASPRPGRGCRPRCSPRRPVHSACRDRA